MYDNCGQRLVRPADVFLLHGGAARAGQKRLRQAYRCCLGRDLLRWLGKLRFNGLGLLPQPLRVFPAGKAEIRFAGFRHDCSARWMISWASSLNWWWQTLFGAYSPIHWPVKTASRMATALLISVSKVGPR